ncbi:MAG: ElyC/SanA/YdcF family protein [Bacteroidota bacterium]
MNLLLKSGLFLIGSGLLMLMLVVLCNIWMIRSTQTLVFDELQALPNNEVALVLGTNPLIQQKYRNPYFDRRIEAAHSLYAAGKVKHFLLSGDNHRQGYNEPEAMKKALMAKGVPESAITLDFAGFRTLDSVVRGKKVFQQDRFTILSQEFHNYRALFIAQHHGIDAVAYNAQAVTSLSQKTIYREYLARCKAVLDLYLLHKQPKFLGEKIDLNISSK